MKKSIDVLSYLVQAIVNNPDDVIVESKTDELGVLLTLHVNKEDMGLVIGRAGSTAKAIRTLIRTVGMQERSRINIKIAEPEGSTHNPQSEY